MRRSPLLLQATKEAALNSTAGGRRQSQAIAIDDRSYLNLE
jgi:hypothetical protein